MSTLNDAMCELWRLSAVSTDVEGTYTLHPDVKATVLEKLPSASYPFWRLQALITAYRAVPWKYLEVVEPHLGATLTTHVAHTLTAVREHDGYESLSMSDRVDIVLTLIKASQFPGMEWKRLAVSQAKATMCGLQDQALDLFQNEDLSSAMDTLKEWRLTKPASSTKEAVLFRMNLLRGKILRFQGKFQDSLECLSKSRCAAEQLGELHFDEDATDLVVEVADTVIELNDPIRAEQLLKEQLERQYYTPAARALLSLSLAESLFAQQRFLEADRLCRDVESQQLSKMARLRLCITAATLRGHATRIIYVSLCNVLKH
ncbi:uncharacterized protein GLRG_11841 [Colletotrichum graminicola M1.001]|uniref:TPR domain-containing protein n=1 Tax=Colletotrichum graminicola (strain M1.001 / M2 / FGSC 10212) TaxID=645133 RepID=E3R0U6_COLGM|nr:uncharacterized protein GLRG_11841 [Colletotrichum graminicola M1.001]EFQ36734.1 hypothetical protein GLRG_11841 [Colletotrichum graminicola M1.001]